MALAGHFVTVTLDDAGGTPQTFAAGDITSVDLGLTYIQHDVTGLGDEAQSFINGQIQNPVTLKGFLTTTPDWGTHTVIRDVFQQKKVVTLEVQVGNNAAPTGGDPKYGGEFVIESYKPSINPNGAVTFEAMLKPAGGTDPNWTT